MCALVVWGAGDVSEKCTLQSCGALRNQKSLVNFGSRAPKIEMYGSFTGDRTNLVYAINLKENKHESDNPKGNSCTGLRGQGV